MNLTELATPAVTLGFLLVVFGAVSFLLVGLAHSANSPSPASPAEDLQRSASAAWPMSRTVKSKNRGGSGRSRSTESARSSACSRLGVLVSCVLNSLSKCDRV